MKPCGYCGRENEDEAVHCRECGTVFEVMAPQANMPPQVQTEQDPWTKQDLMKVAKGQKTIILMLLLSLAATLIHFATLVTGMIQIYFIYKLAAALRSSTAWVYIILAFIPFVGLIALLVLNGKATKKLRENGIEVGLMGARMADIDQMP